MSQSLFPPIASVGALDALRVCSLSHRTCGLPALGDVIAHGDASRLLAALTAAGIESIVLATCNRFEVYWRSTRSTDDHAVSRAVDAALPLASGLLDEGAARMSGGEAARHLFRVCSGLESVVIGEAEILGQVRAAMEASNPGPFLKGIFTAGIRTGRTARAVTGIAHGAMSVASVAVQQLRNLQTGSAMRIVIVGAGGTAAKVARHVASIGVASLVVANRTLERARELAAMCGGTAIAIDALADEIANADVVVCAASSEGWMVTRGHIADRRARPLILVDIVMPPGIEPFEADGVTRIDLAAIEQATAEHRRRRADEIPRVEAVIARELDWLQSWAQRRTSRPLSGA